MQLGNVLASLLLQLQLNAEVGRVLWPHREQHEVEQVLFNLRQRHGGFAEVGRHGLKGRQHGLLALQALLIAPLGRPCRLLYLLLHQLDLLRAEVAIKSAKPVDAAVEAFFGAFLWIALKPIFFPVFVPNRPFFFQMLELFGPQLADHGRGQPAAFDHEGLDSLLGTGPNGAGLLWRDVMGHHGLGLRQEVGHGGELFFAVPSLELFQGHFGLRGLGVVEIDVAV